MKRLIVLMALVVFSGTSMAGISSDSFESWYDDLLDLLNLLDDEELADDEYLVNDVSAAPASSEADFSASVSTADESNPGVLPVAGDLDSGLIPEAVSEGGEASAIANPEPCSIILSSIGLGIAGYLRRRRAI